MNAAVLSALQKSQWSGKVPGKKLARRCIVCEQLESVGAHSDDCYIGQALASVGQDAPPWRFTASDNGKPEQLLSTTTKAVALAITSQTLPPNGMLVEREVHLEISGVKSHVWTHGKDRSTTFTPAGRRLIELLDKIDASEALRSPDSQFYRYKGRAAVDILCFEVGENRVLMYGRDMNAKDSPLSAGDIHNLVAEGKAERIERPAELLRAA